MIDTIRSLADARALTRLVQERYDLDARTCTLLRSLSNDVYAVEVTDQRYALKVYAAGGWSLDEVVWEQDFASYLTDVGIPVAEVVPLADGRLADHLDAPEGRRPFALTRFVEGHKPAPPFDDALYHAFGTLIGRVHVAADGFRSEHTRRALDRSTLLDGPLDELSLALAAAPDDLRLVREIATAAGEAVDRVADGGLRWGVRHGDVTLDNLHTTDGGLVLHDFDSAAPGWQAADLTGVRATDQWGAFRSGYVEVADLSDAEEAALPWLSAMERISNLAFHLVDKPAMHGTESIGEGWAESELTALRDAARRLL